MGRLTRFLKNRFIEHVELRADGTRAFRAMVAFSVPLIVCHALNQPADALFISMASMNLSLPDLRGAYRVRLGILAAMTLVAASSALLGVMMADRPVGAVAAMGIIALFGGLWRHLSSDYGPSMAVSSALLFLLGLSQPSGWTDALQLASWVALGGAFATFLHGCFWLFRPQHALRYSVAETWVAAADLVAAMRPGVTADKTARSQSVAKLEGDLRATLDRTFVILGEAKNRKQAALITHLEAVRREVVHFTMRVIALNASLEPLMDRPDFAGCLPVVDSVLKTLSDAARSSAITVIMHRAENLAASKVRLRRCQHLIKTLDEQIAVALADGAALAPVRATLDEVEKELPRIQAVLEETADYAVPHRVFSANLPDLSALSIQSLGAWMRPSSRPDPVLVRHAVRAAVFTMIAVGIYKGFNIPRGYWIAFTIMVVLQPDYGSTRQRAGARIAGTVGGIVLAGLLVWFKPPVLLLDSLATLTAFFFAYYLKRSYGLAIFFVTINLVLVTESMSSVRRDFMEARILSTLLGGGLALLAARVFWPVWEGRKFPVLLAGAIRANRTFLFSLSPWLGLPPTGAPDVLMAKRRAENTNRSVAASVERLLGEPSGLHENPERAAALATYNQRVTRALTVLAVQLPAAGVGTHVATVSTMAGRISEVFEKLALVIEQGMAEGAVAELTADLVKLEAEFAGARSSAANDPDLTASPASLARVQLAKMIAEIRAMTLAMTPSPAIAAAG